MSTRNYMNETYISVCTFEHSHSLEPPQMEVFDRGRNTELRKQEAQDHWQRHVLLQFEWFREAVETVGRVRVLSALATW